MIISHCPELPSFDYSDYHAAPAAWGIAPTFLPGNEILLMPYCPTNLLSIPTEIGSISYQRTWLMKNSQNNPLERAPSALNNIASLSKIQSTK